MKRLGLVLVLPMLLAALTLAQPTVNAPLAEALTVKGTINFFSDFSGNRTVTLTLSMAFDALVDINSLGYSTSWATINYVLGYVNGVLVYDSRQTPPFLRAVPVKKGETAKVEVILNVAASFGSSISLDWGTRIRFNTTATLDGTKLSLTMRSAYTNLGVTGIANTEFSTFVVAPIMQVKEAVGERPITYDAFSVTYSGAPPLPANKVTVTLEPIPAPQHPNSWTVTYPSGFREEVTWTGTGKVLLGVELTPKLENTVFTLYLNGTKVTSVKPTKEGLFNLTGIYVTSDPYTIFAARASTTFRAYKLVLKEADLPEPVKATFTGTAPTFDLKVSAAGAAIYVRNALKVGWNTEHLATVGATKEYNDTTSTVTVTPSIPYVEVEPGNMFEKVIILGGGSVVPAAPTVVDVAVTQNTVGIYAKGKRPLIAAVGPDGKYIVTSRDGLHALIPVRAQGTHTLKLETKLTVQNVYEGKAIDATVIVLKDNVEVARSRGSTLEFALEPMVTYTVKGDNGNEVLSTTIFLSQDVAHAFTYSKSPAFTLPIPIEFIIAALLVLIAVILIVILAKGLKIGIQVG